MMTKVHYSLAIIIAYMMTGVGSAEPANSTNELPSWWERVKRIEVGTTRAQVESVLPTNSASEVVSAGAVAGGRGSWSYYFTDGWIVTIGYEAPMGRKNGIRAWDYSSPNARVIETPKISHRNTKWGEQGGPGYPPQGVGSPDP